ncbi:MAG: hypothetical protein U0232_00600 [Thermomicrobiales bacterium]
MIGPLLETKVYLPRPRRALVLRSRLHERLDRGVEGGLTLVSAPPGFGKTTLLAEWLGAASASERSAAWLSLDQGDNQPGVFWTYLIAALRTVVPGIGTGALALLESPQPVPIDAILTTLVNELAALPHDVVLVLDDYHVIDAREVREGMVFLLDHLPARLHLVIASRADPALPLTRLRVRGELTEIRVADLRFAADEAAAFLNATMGLALSTSEVAALETRTEGWIAGLQLAALSLQGRADVPSFVRAFAGDDRYVLDYLVEEVLQRQPAAVRAFLLDTAILDRLSGSLCDAVTGREGGAGVLEALERGNLFVVPLDDKRHWYRYHHLFADVLRAYLLDEQPERVPELHRRASAWFEQHGESSEAIRHALAAGDFARVAALIERALPVLRRSRMGVTLIGWLAALPDDVIRQRPVLSVVYAWALLEHNQFDGVEARLRDAERWFAAAADEPGRPGVLSSEMIVEDEEEFRRLPATIAIYRAAQTQAVGDVAATVVHARRVLDLVPEDDHLRRGAAAGFLGLASWASGDLEAAYGTYAAGMESLRRAGHIADFIGGALVMADIRVAQGRLRDAERILEQGVQRATEQGDPRLHGPADLLLALGEIGRERNDLEAATRHLLRSRELAVGMGVPHDRSRWCVAMARVREAEGDLDGALDLLDEAERLEVRGYLPQVRTVAARKVRVWVAHGRLGDALGWVRERGLSPDDDLSYLREFEHLTLVRVLLARDVADRTRRATQEVPRFLARLLHAAEAGGRLGSVIENLVLQALAYRARGDVVAALGPLGRALALAEPEGYVRVFLDEGPPLVALLEAAAKQGIAPNVVTRLLAGEGKAEERTSAKQDVVEPLSERELDVLRLLGTDLDGPEIARELMVSLNTMRTHEEYLRQARGE